MADWREALAAAKPGDYGVIGDPILHSLSLRLQQPALDQWWREKGGHHEKTPRYILFHVHAADLRAFVQEAKFRRLAGFNVTVPHKTSVMSHLDRLDSFARTVGAVNTVKLEGHGYAGYNTDGYGFARALREMSLAPQTALVLGAGGTGQVIVHQLLALDVKKIYWWNRSAGRLSSAPREITQHPAVHLMEAAVSLAAAGGDVELVVNATSVGLKADEGLPIPGMNFQNVKAAFDVVYHRNTVFLQEAKAAGAKVCGGLPMLLYQGAEAFRIWTGTEAPVELMKTALLKAVKEKGIEPVWP